MRRERNFEGRVQNKFVESGSQAREEGRKDMEGEEGERTREGSGNDDVHIAKQDEKYPELPKSPRPTHGKPSGSGPLLTRHGLAGSVIFSVVL